MIPTRILLISISKIESIFLCYQILHFLKQDGFALKNAKEFQHNEKIVMEAVKQKGKALEFASEKLQNNKKL
jgi:hypothetical protein